MPLCNTYSLRVIASLALPTHNPCLHEGDDDEDVPESDGRAGAHQIMKSQCSVLGNETQKTSLNTHVQRRNYNYKDVKKHKQTRHRPKEAN